MLSYLTMKCYQMNDKTFLTSDKFLFIIHRVSCKVFQI